MRRGLIAGLVAVALFAASCDGDDQSAGEPETEPGTSEPGTSEPGTSTSADSPAELPEPRTEVAGAVWDGRIIVVGGLTEDGEPSGRADAYDPDGNSWERLPDLPRPLHHTGVVSFDDRAWVIGGYAMFEGDAWVPVRTAYSLGEAEEEWRSEPEMTEIRGALAVAVVGDVVVVAGGTDGTKVLATTEVLALGADDWVPGPTMTEAREHFAMASDGDVIYAVAGRRGGAENNLATTEVLAGDAWSKGLPLSHSRSGIGAAPVGDRICVAGGEEPAGTIASVECTVEDGWEVAGELRAPRHGLAVVALGRRLHVIGGGPEPGLTVSATHEVIELPS